MFNKKGIIGDEERNQWANKNDILYVNTPVYTNIKNII